MEKDQIIRLILEVLKEMGEDQSKKEFLAAEQNTPLYGKGGIMDSLNLVMLSSELELRIEEKSGQQIVLADEKALSMRLSPFRSVEALAVFIQGQLSTNAAHE